MGMYTELVCSFELADGVPEHVVQAIKFMIGEVTDMPHLPGGGLDLAGMQWMLATDSYYFAGDSRSTVRFDEVAKAWMVTVRCNLKNYQQEIQKFIRWVAPFVNAMKDDFIGYMRYEEDEVPILILHPAKFMKVIHMVPAEE